MLYFLKRNKNNLAQQADSLMAKKELEKNQGNKAVIAPKTRKKRIKDKIKKQKIMLLRSIKRISMYVALQCAATIPQAGNTLTGSKPVPLDSDKGKTVLRYEAAAAAEINTALQKRKEWLIKEKFLPNIVKYHNTIKKKAPKAKEDYIKKNFFDVVWPIGGITPGSNYCVAGLMRCLYDVNKETGDLEKFIPDPKSRGDGHGTVSCPEFEKYVKKYFPDCVVIKPSAADISGLEEGDLILSRSEDNSVSGLHMTTIYNKKQGLEASFNNDEIRPYKPKKIYLILKMGKVLDICLRDKINNLDARTALNSLKNGIEKGDLQFSAGNFAQVTMSRGGR